MNAMRLFLRLLRIEIQRCQAAPVAVLALAVAWPLRQFDRDGVVLWQDVSQNVVDAHLVYAPLGAAIAVWAVGRSRRRGMGDQEAALPATQGWTDLIVSLAVASWMLLAYFAFFVFCAIPAIRLATWGGPNVPMMLAGAMAIVVCVGFGSLVSRLGRTAVLAPATLIATYAAMVYVADSMWYSPRARLMPTKFFDEIQLGAASSVSSDRTYWLSGWLLAVSVACWGLFLLIRSRSVLRVVVIVIAGMVAAFSANQVMAEPTYVDQPLGELETLACEMASGIEVCVHPAYVSLLDDVVAKVNTIAPAFVGLSGVPATMYQQEAAWVSNFEKPFNSSFSLWDKSTIEFSIPQTFIALTFDPQVRANLDRHDASQCAVGMALVGIVSMYPHCAINIVSSKMTQVRPSGEEPWEYTPPDEAEVAEMTRQIDAKAATFAALSPEVRQAWLNENWDALRAGELELDDLP